MKVQTRINLARHLKIKKTPLASSAPTSWRRWRVVIGAGAFATSVTIASIPVPDTRTVNALEADQPASPAQTLIYSERIATPRNFSPESTLALFSFGESNSSNNSTDLSRVEIEPSDTLARILRGQRIDAPDLLNAVHRHPSAEPLNRLIPGQQLSLRTNAAGQLQELIQDIEPNDTLRLTRAASGFDVRRERREFEVRLAYVTGTIERSLFEDGQSAGLSDPLITGLAEIFGWDIDFALDLLPGDSFSVVYEEKYWRGQKVADGDIRAAEFVNRGRVYRAIGLRQPDGSINYYTPTGMALRRAFLRTPVKFSRVSSSFSNRRFHPILKTWREHKGVDYAAPVGTPVQATASGEVLSMGWNGGYGNTITLKHAGPYSTLYAHLSRFRPGLAVGQRVEQGEVLGYVGQTGLTTGPHLHYEFQVNGAHQNPMTFEFPGVAAIPSVFRADFQHEVGAWLDKLDAIGTARLASIQDNTH